MVFAFLSAIITAFDTTTPSLQNWMKISTLMMKNLGGPQKQGSEQWVFEKNRVAEAHFRKKLRPEINTGKVEKGMEFHS